MPSSLFQKKASIAASLLAIASKVLAQQSEPGFLWFSPTTGAKYVSGDIITLKWKTDMRLMSPRLLICNAYGSRDKCTPQSSPKSDLTPGTYAFDVTAPKISGVEDFVFVLEEDGTGRRHESPLFAVGTPPSGSPKALLEKVTASLPQASAPLTTSNATTTSAAPAATTSTVMEAIFGKSTPKESAGIGLGLSFGTIAFVLAVVGYWKWNKRRNARRRAAADGDSEVGPSISRSSSYASSIYKTPVARGGARGGRRFSASSGRPSARPGVLRRTSSQPASSRSLHRAALRPGGDATSIHRGRTFIHSAKEGSPPRGHATRTRPRTPREENKEYFDNDEYEYDPRDSAVIQPPARAYDPNDESYKERRQ